MKWLKKLWKEFFAWDPALPEEKNPPTLEELALAAFINREAIDRLLEVRQSVSVDISATSGEVRSALWDVVRAIDGHLKDLTAK